MRGLEDQVDLLEVAVEMDARSACTTTGTIYSRGLPSLGLDEREVDDDDAQSVERCVEQIETGSWLRRGSSTPPEADDSPPADVANGDRG